MMSVAVYRIGAIAQVKAINDILYTLRAMLMIAHMEPFRDRPIGATR